MHYYTYAYLDPRKPGSYQYSNVDHIFAFEPFYIGKGKETRFKRHLNRSQLEAGNNPHKERTLKKLIKLGYNPLNYVVIIRTDMDEVGAVKNEMTLIANIGRWNLGTGPLTNLTEGGEGMWGHRSGLKGRTYEEIHGVERAAELKEERRLRFMGKKNPMSGKPSWSKGKHLSPETCKKISEAHSKSINQLDKESKFVKTWNSAAEAAEFLGISVSGIHNCVNPNYHTRSAGGYRWEYSDKPNLKYVGEHIPTNQRYYAVIHPDGFVGYTTSLYNYAKTIGQSSSELYKISNGKIKQTNGYRIKRVSREEYLEHK